MGDPLECEGMIRMRMQNHVGWNSKLGSAYGICIIECRMSWITETSE